MSNAVTLQELQQRLFNVHGDVVTIVPETYVKITIPAVFNDKDFGTFTANISNVLKGCRHLKNRSFQTKVKLTRSLDEVEARLFHIHGTQVSLVKETYKGVSQTAQFIDETYGMWEAQVKKVLIGHHHPMRAKMHRQQKLRMSREDVVKQLKIIHGDQITLGDDYVSVTRKATFIDNELGQWKTIVRSVLSGTSHPGRKQQKIARSLSKRRPIFHWKLVICAVLFQTGNIESFHG